MKKKTQNLSLLLVIVWLISCFTIGCSNDVIEEYDDTDLDYSDSTSDDLDNTPSTTDKDEYNEDIHNDADKVSVSFGSAKGPFFEIDFTKDGKEYTGVANKNGKILYYADESVDLYFTSIGENAGYLTETVGSEKTYTLINSAGTKKTFDANAFDLVIGEGGGYMLVYKNTGNASRAEHSYGLINKNGEWEKPLTPGEACSALVTIDAFNRFKHMGNQVFAYVEGYHCMIFDGQNNKMIDLEDCTLLSTSFSNDRFFVRDGGETYLYHKDGTRKTTEDIIEASDKMALYKEAGKLQVLNLVTNDTNVYDALPADSIVGIECVGDYALLSINGQDGRCYFTVIDANGQQMFEPKLCRNHINIGLFGDIVVYATPSNYDEAVDVHGNLVISKDREFTDLYTEGGQGFRGTVNTVTCVLVDQNGEEVTFYLPKDTPKG